MSPIFSVAVAVLIVVLLIIAVVAAAAVVRASPAPRMAVAVFDPAATSNSGKLAGTVTFLQDRPGKDTRVRIRLSGFAAGTTHGIHVHKHGDLTRGCESACEHFNGSRRPTEHGSQKLYGKDRHTGDMCNNITADMSGNVDFEYLDDLITLGGAQSVVGRAVVIHVNPDDLGAFRDTPSPRGVESGKTGNAGKRIACAVIGVAG